LLLLNSRPNNLLVLFPQGSKGQRQVPFIRLAGGWLSDAGFGEGDQVLVTVARGEIRLLRDPATPLPQKRQPELFN